MPAKGTTRVTDEQRKRIAAGRTLGKTRKAIAEETGLAPQTVANQLADPRTATLILEFKHKSRAQLDRIWLKTLNRIEADIHHKELARSAAARGQFIRILTAGDPPLLRIAPADNSGGDCTLEELIITYRRASIGG
jgi:hypothetical protein